jgi:hypothetical protein
MADLAPSGTPGGPRFSPHQEQKHQQANSSNSNSSSSYDVSNAAYKDIINTDEPVHVLVEKDYNFAHEGPVYLAKFNKVHAPAKVLAFLRSPLGRCSRCN